MDRNPLTRGGEELWPEGDSPSRHRLRRVFNTIVARLGRVDPRAAIVALDRLARLAHRTGALQPTAHDVATLYDWIPRRRARPIAREIAALRVKNLGAIALVQDDQLADLSALVRWAPDTATEELFVRGAGVILVAAHVGAFFGIRAGLFRAGRSSVMLRDLPLAEPAARARALKQAVDCLRDGGLVVATLDGPGGTSSDPVACLGRHVVLRRGPFALARFTRAPLIPVVCAWTPGGSIEVRAEDAIAFPAEEELAPSAFEGGLAAAAARWLDAYLRAHPQQIWPSTLRHYSAAPRLAVDRESYVHR